MSIWSSCKSFTVPACDNFGQPEPGDRTFHIGLARAGEFSDRLRLSVGEEAHPDYDTPWADAYLTADEARALATALQEVAADLP